MQGMKSFIVVKETRISLFLKNFLSAFVILLFFISLSHAEENENKAKTIVSKIIDAYGGTKHLAKITSMSAEGHIKSFFNKDEGTYFRYIKRERKLYVEIKYSRSAEKRILNGDKGYRGTGEKLSEAKGPSYDAMVYQYNQLDLPYGFIDNFFRVTYLRKDSLDNVAVEVLKLEDKYNHDIEVYISAKDFMILRVIGTFGKDDSAMCLSAEFSDYKKVEGTLLPFKITNYADNSKISETEMTKYSVNPSIDESTYFSVR
jgi:hypothetical protein